MGELLHYNSNDLKKLLQLAGELRELRQDASRRTRHLLSGLAEVLRAPLAYAMIVQRQEAGRGASPPGSNHAPGHRAHIHPASPHPASPHPASPHPMSIEPARLGPAATPPPGHLVSAVQVGWDEPQPPTAVSRYLQTGLPADPALERLHHLLARPSFNHEAHAPLELTRCREELVSSRVWKACPHVKEFRRPLGMGESLYSAMSLNGTRLIATLVFNRPATDRHRFLPREKAMLQAMHSQLQWHYQAGLKQHRPEANLLLSPRQDQTLRLLLSGMSEKQIAAILNLSPNTVHHYVKAIYRHYGVGTRSELLARWVRN